MKDLIEVIACLRIIASAEDKKLGSNDTLIRVLRECADRLEGERRELTNKNFSELMVAIRQIKSETLNGKIPGIKKCRELFNCGLKEAKDYVEEFCVPELQQYELKWQPKR